MPEENAATEEAEGQLAVDVYHTDEAIVIRAPIAGVKKSDLSIMVTDDVITIKGRRHLAEDIPGENYFTRECYWGPFSRSIVLPAHILKQKISAQYHNGILKIVIPKGEDMKPKVVKITPS